MTRPHGANPWSPSAHDSQGASLDYFVTEPAAVNDHHQGPGAPGSTTTRLQSEGATVGYHVPALVGLSSTSDGRSRGHHTKIFLHAVEDNVCAVYATDQQGAFSGAFGDYSGYAEIPYNGGYDGIQHSLFGDPYTQPYGQYVGHAYDNTPVHPSHKETCIGIDPHNAWLSSMNGMSQSATYSHERSTVRDAGFLAQEARDNLCNVDNAPSQWTLGIRQDSNSLAQGSTRGVSTMEYKHGWVSSSSISDASISVGGVPIFAHQSETPWSMPTSLASADAGLTASPTSERFPASALEDRLEALLNGWQKSTGRTLSTFDALMSLRNYCECKLRARHGADMVDSIFHKPIKEVVGTRIDRARRTRGEPSQGTEEGYKCPVLVCQARHTRKHNYLLHIGAHLGMTDCRCERCDKYFTASSIERHKKTCSKKYPEAPPKVLGTSQR